jgi:N-acetylneuraminate synthase
MRELDRSFIIAEAGVNHNGDLNLARSLVDAAASSGADAVKFQTFRADHLASAAAPKAEYQRANTDSEETQLEMLRKLELSEADHIHIIKHCNRRQILFLSTPFDEVSANLLERLDVALFKIPSGEITNLPFLEHVAAKGKPIILSTGMATLGEVEKAVQTIQSTGNRRLALLHCVSRYPAAYAESNLRAMKTLETAFGVPVGFSDHTPGIQVPIAAAALGAQIIEKHVTLDQSLPGPDHKASITPKTLEQLIQAVRIVESALGDGRKQPSANEAAIAAIARKSLVAGHDIPAGTVLTDEMLEIKRPGTGMSPEMKSIVVGMRAATHIGAGTLFSWDLIQ